MKIPDYNKKIKHPTYLEMIEEIKRLKEEYVMLQNASDKVEEELQQRIDKAIEYIEIIQYNESYGVKENDYLDLLDILKGVDED